jgi:hypothetical protein
MPSFVALLLVDSIAIATIARCFNGPSELLLIVPMVIGAHLIARLARLVTHNGHGGLGTAIWALAVVLVVYVPIATLDGGSLSWLLPLGATRHLLHLELSGAWKIFADKVAPVATQRGLVLVSGWAAGAVGLAAEALDADAALPKIVALVPAFDVVVFTGTLGTATGRGPALAALAALSVWYLAIAARQPAGEQIVTARLEGAAATGGPARVTGTLARARSPRRGRPPLPRLTPPRSRKLTIVAPGLVALAALSAGLIGPLLPGATSDALVAWHGGRDTRHHSTHNTSGNGPVSVSSLVQVGEQEVNNPNTLLFDVYSPVAGTREQLITLDHFNGNQWTSSAVADPAHEPGSNVASFPSSLTALELHPNPVQLVGGQNFITQVIAIDNLAGDYLPTPGPTEGLSGADAWAPQPGSPVEGKTGLTPQTAYAVRALLDPPPPPLGSSATLPGASPNIPASMDQYLALPSGLPPSIAALAHHIIGAQLGESSEALALQDFFSAANGFRYNLPKKLPGGAIGDQGEGYRALTAFLFQNKSGYCQQYASAMAVLARAVGIPSRVVVGFLSGQAVGSDAWEVTGLQVHAWPQLWFPGTGWVDYEPTPGSPQPVTIGTIPTGTIPPTIPGGGTTVPTTFAHNLHPPTAGGGTTAPPHHTARHHGGGSKDAPLDVVLALLAAAALWLVVAPGVRVLAERRTQRDPARGVLSSWRATQRILAVAGLHRRRAETFPEFAQRVRMAGVLNADADDALRRMARVANHAAFSLRPPTASQAAKVRADAAVVQRIARRRIPRWQRLVLIVDPRQTASLA